MSAAVILVVDDSPSVVLATRRALRDSGHELFSATSVAEAEQAWLDQRPDLVLLDVNLPDGNGIEVCHRWKADEDRRSVPIILRSSVSVSAGEQALGLVGGADGYLTEPVEPEVLRATINAHLRIVDLLDDLEQSSEWATAMVDYSIAVARTESVDDVLKQVEAHARTALNASETRLRWRNERAGTTEWFGEPLDGSTDFLDYLIDTSTEEHMFFTDRSTLAVGHPEIPSEQGSWAVMSFDVLDAQGMLAVGCAGEQPFSPAQRQLFRTFTSITALSLSRTAALDLYRSIAETLQEALLPEAQLTSDVLVRRKLFVAEGATTAGGDWYDGYALPSGRQALVIGDVVGHGARAAGRSAIFRHTLRTLLLTGSEPGESLVQLEGLVRSHPDRPAGSLLLAEIFVEQRQAHLFVSAHPPPVLISPTGEASVVSVDPAPPLGSGLLTAEPLPTVVDLSGGSILVFITDGVVERRSESLDRSYERLRRALTNVTSVDRAMSVIEELIDQRSLQDDALFVALALAPTDEP